MGFEIFNKSEIEEMYSTMIENMKEEQKQVFIEQYGSISFCERVWYSLS